jgi:hypothetical protein
MPEPPFIITRRSPHLFEAINGGAVFAISRQPADPEFQVCSYGGIETGPMSRIMWKNIPIAIRKAARQHFDGLRDRSLAA